MNSKSKITEGLETGDLVDRVDAVVHFDEYVPKMGDAEDVIVASFKVLGDKAAYDLENFFEKGYEWILDADVSPGEISSGYYIVFVEAPRSHIYPKNFVELISDLEKLTGVPDDDWNMVYYATSKTTKSDQEPLTKENLKSKIPLSPLKYKELKSSFGLLESMIDIARIPRKVIKHTATSYQPKER